MARDKERSINPAQAQRKADKAKALKKSRNEQQARRNERLARRNPIGVQRQIDDLKALEASGQIKPREKDILAELERDLRAIKKAKETLGDKAPSVGQRQSNDRRNGGANSQGSVLGKRRHDGERKRYDDEVSSGSETDESVRNIPMPRDTPPPLPREFRRNFPQQNSQSQGQDQGQGQQSSRQPSVPVVQPKTTYSSAPQLRDLRKEAVSKFVPDAVRRKQDAARGQGGLLEPEEMDKLEQEGYYRQTQSSLGTTSEKMEANQVLTDAEAKRLNEEEERFERELAESMDVDEIHDVRPSRPKTEPVSTGISNLLPDGNHAAGHQSVMDQAEDGEDDEDEEDYLPPLLSGSNKPGTSTSMFANLPRPQASTESNSNSAIPTGGLFSSLPKPQIKRQVEMEEVEDEDFQ